MTGQRSTRPSWRRKRLWAVLLVWLAAAYPMSLGPVGFVRGYRQIGYNPPAVYAPILPPNRAIFLEGGDWRHWLGRYYVWCWRVGSERSPYPAVP